MGSNPTLSAIPRLNNPYLRIVVRPGAGWEAVRAASPRWSVPLFAHALPLSLLPAVSWPLGHALDPIGPEVLSAAALASSFASTLVLCMAVVTLAALAIYALAPLFEARRQWDLAVSVAAYSSTPVLLGAPLLVSAALTIVAIVALFHACALCSLGLRSIVGCREEDAPMYVAMVAVLTGVAGMLLGALCSAAGIL